MQNVPETALVDVSPAVADSNRIKSDSSTMASLQSWDVALRWQNREAEAIEVVEKRVCIGTICLFFVQHIGEIDLTRSQRKKLSHGKTVEKTCRSKHHTALLLLITGIVHR